MIRRVQVALGERSYEVRVGSALLEELRQTLDAMNSRRAVVISDRNVAKLYGEELVRILRAVNFLDIDLLQMLPGEENKTLDACSSLYDLLFTLRSPIDRKTVIVALGGGVTGDVAGFVAATALRGLRCVQCPTTLLAAVDASVGGKTGVDHPAGKNLIGAFHQPSAVLIDVDLLKTLPDAELASGLAECVKHGVIRDAGLLDFIENREEAILARDAETLTELIARNVAIKAAVVSADEREAGERMHLNFGHTIGHAIENQVGYGRISHGQAVSLGMVAACHMAAGRGLLDAPAAGRVEGLLKRLGLPTRWKGLAAAGLWSIMLHDKKAREGKVAMVLPIRLGHVAVFSDINGKDIERAAAALGR